MIVNITEQIQFEVSYSPLDHEDPYEDDIRFGICESCPEDEKMLVADQVSILLTPEQAEQLAVALAVCAEESRRMSG